MMDTSYPPPGLALPPPFGAPPQPYSVPPQMQPTFTSLPPPHTPHPPVDTSNPKQYNLNIIQVPDSSDIVELYTTAGLYLKPIAKLNITVQIPQMRASSPAISTVQIIDNVKKICKPNDFHNEKVIKSTMEFIRLEGEIQSKDNLENLIKSLNQQSILLSEFSDPLKLRASEGKIVFPTRNDWDSFFRDAKNMNQLKPGERPDTVIIRNLPSRWFAGSRDVDKPSDFILKKAFEGFGDIRYVDIPSLDKHRLAMSEDISGIPKNFVEQEGVFDAYIQYKEYMGFVKAMNSLRGMKLLFKDPYSKNNFIVDIKVSRI